MTESSRLPLAARERETKREPSEKEREEGGVDKLVGRETNTQKERNNFDGVKKNTKNTKYPRGIKEGGKHEKAKKKSKA